MILHILIFLWLGDTLPECGRWISRSTRICSQPDPLHLVLREHLSHDVVRERFFTPRLRVASYDELKSAAVNPAV
jgi:hypothetical protein